MDLTGATQDPMAEEVPETPQSILKKEGEAGTPVQVEDDLEPTPCDKDDHDYNPSQGRKQTKGKKRTRAQTRSRTETPACPPSPSEQVASKKQKTNAKPTSPVRLKLTNINKGKRSEDNATIELLCQMSKISSEKTTQLLQVEHENEQLKARIERLENASGAQHGLFSHLCSKLEQTEQENDHLQHRLQQTRALIGNVSRDYEQLQSKLDKEREDYRPVYEDEIVSKWSGLQFAIQNLVMAHLAARPSLTGEEDESAIIRTAGVCQSQPRIAIFHLQNHIWRRLISDLFQGNQEIVLGPLAEIFFALRKKLTHEIRSDPSKGKALSQLKSNTAHMLFDTYGVDATAKDALVQDLAKELRMFVSEGESRDTYVKELAAIVDKAIDLQSIFIKSKAFFAIGTSGLGPGKDVDLNKCEVYQTWCDRPEEERKIQVMVSPMVMKIGNAAGHDDSFGVASPICKARVVIG